MREYQKPIIIEETIELEDVVALSNGGSGDADSNGLKVTPDQIWG